MKNIRCKDMGGVCEFVVKGDTATEIALRAMNHYREMTDEEHRTIVKRIEACTSEETSLWRSDFQKQFDAAPDIKAS